MTESISATNPRVRFAPSPTGYFHVGSARAALFNWLFACQHNGTLVLRIEDTDEARNRTEWTDGIISAMDWLGMSPDEGPYLQSEQGEVHAAAIEALWAAGALYACACTREDIDARFAIRKAAGDPTPGYDGHCRDLGLERGDGRALRFCTPDDGTTTVIDLVRGDVEFPNRAIEDFICVKGNGLPLFALANAVDDRTMTISHVIRGEEHLPNTPKQMMLWEALNRATSSDLALPTFAHLPLLVNEQGKKLSKRRDPVAVEMYREQGYLPEPFRNYLGLLGWSPGDEEIVPIELMIERFRLEDVQRSPAFFDIKKCAHINGVFIRGLTDNGFATAARPWVDPMDDQWSPGAWQDPDADATKHVGPSWPPESFDAEVFARIAPVVQERVTILSEVPDMVDFLFLSEPVMDGDSWDKAIGRDEVAGALLRGADSAYATCEWNRDELHRVTLELGESLGRALGKAQAPIRVAVTGKRVGPPLFESLEVLGRDETRRRIANALERLGDSG